MKEIAALKKEGFDIPFVKFLLRKDNVLIMEWKGFVKADLIKEAHEKALSVIKENNVTGLVEDVVNFTGPFTEVNQWFISYWVPAALKVGLKKAGVLMSSSYFTQLSVEQLKENSEFKRLGLGYRIFGEMNKATDWLLEGVTVG